jgi:hypothetical protein
LLRPIVLLLTLLALVGSGCVARAAEPTAAPSPDCVDTASLHVVIGISGHDLNAAARRGALKAVLDQLAARVRPGNSRLVVSAYPLGDHSLSSEPLRLSLACLPATPEALDLKQAPTFERARRLDAYRHELETTRKAVDQARRQFDAYGSQLLALEPRSTATDIWGFLVLAADEFASNKATERDVIVVARDEEIDTTYCDGCQPLRGARVHFLAFDQLTPADQQRRRAEWSAWLAAVGAGGSTFTRSNETIPALFGQAGTSTPSALASGVDHA